MSVPPSDILQKYSMTWGRVRRDLRDPIYLLEHASRCDDLSCKNSMCIKLKASFRHFKECLKFGACEECEYFYHIAFRHASNCKKEWCPTFLCSRIGQVRKTLIPSKEESVKGTNPGPSSSQPVFHESGRKYLNFDEKLLNYIKTMKLVIFTKAQLEPSEEVVQGMESDSQQNAPSTSRDVFEDQDDTEQRSKRFKKEHTDDTIHSMDTE
ncbi:hypothetical protein TNIN_463091 [Trichonephila inaurata madagascariensis]|uniref:TAZ-type domain-containing protein n=1 Tax=Trichonephila inaurata madagascariensis TaxID=2747483 RepID=A0A8X7CCY4_9ARAC|nr:hypothetical protein TNIN_463091 [Trichonephila inaurata madagascariensis]